MKRKENLHKKPIKKIHFSLDGVPEKWDKDLWENLIKKLESMNKNEILKVYNDLGIIFHVPVNNLTKDDLIGVADELIPEDVKKYFLI